MASKYWLKLYHETIYDPKFMMLSPLVRLRFFECLCLAGDFNKDGALPQNDRMAFIFRIPEDQLALEMEELEKAGIASNGKGNWRINNFKKRQKPMAAKERMNRMRDTKQKNKCYEPVTNRNADIDIDKESDKEKKNIKKEFDNIMSEPKKLGDVIDGMMAYAKPPMGEYSYFPEDVQSTIKKVCELWKLKPPKKGGGEYKLWIDDARDLREACGEIGFPVLEKLYKDWINKGCQFNVGGPGSLIKSARGIAGTMRENKPKQVAPDVDLKKARDCPICNGVGLLKDGDKYVSCECQREVIKRLVDKLEEK